MTEVSWPIIKNFIDSKSLSPQHFIHEDTFHIWAFDGAMGLSCKINSTNDPDAYAQYMTYLPRSNKGLAPATVNGIPKTATYEPEGSSATVISHNYSDPCSWFTGSKQIVAETPSSSDGLVFPLSKNRIIDMTHGRCYDEDAHMTANANKWSVSVWVDGVLKIEDKWYKALEADPEASMLRDYSVNYESGTITFHSVISGAVTASYSYADKSYFSLRPGAGKVIAIKTAEVQFSRGTELQAPFVFEVFYNHPTYSWVPVPGTKISYKNAKDFISACNEGQGLIPAWAELTQDVHVFPFKYARPKPIKSSDNVEIRVYSVNNLRTLGEYATATFYITVENE